MLNQAKDQSRPSWHRNSGQLSTSRKAPKQDAHGEHEQHLPAHAHPSADTEELPVCTSRSDKEASGLAVFGKSWILERRRKL